MRKNAFSAVIFTIILMMLFAACIPRFLRSPQQSDGSIAATAAAQTLDAMQTQVFVSTLQAELTRVVSEQQGIGNENQEATQPPAPTNTPQPPEDTAVPPTSTIIIPSATRYIPTATSTPCYWAQFIKDVTIPDETEIEAGRDFTKTWRLKNIGACSWNTGFDIVFVNGNAMNSDAAVDFPKNVAPGETVDISVDMTAPTEEGEYKGNWKLRSDTGVVFGLGSSQSLPFWVEIVVPEDIVEIDPDEPLNFAKYFQSASWSTSEGEPDNEDNYTDGSVYSTRKPDMEKNRVDDELALIMIPGAGDDGYIVGKYPAVNIEEGDRFTAIIGCTSQKPKCNVTFVINYRLDDGSTHTLGSWDEVYDGEWTTLDIDLDDLAGESVRFHLRVENNGSSKDDRVFWLLPLIRRD